MHWPGTALAPEPSLPEPASRFSSGEELLPVGHETLATSNPGEAPPDLPPSEPLGSHGAGLGGEPRACPRAEVYGPLPEQREWGGRSVGHGGPALPVYADESWLRRPLYAGAFVGYMQGSELVDDWVGQQGGPFTGLRLGWDFHESFGGRTEIGFASLSLYDSARAIAARKRLDDEAELDPLDPERIRHGMRRYGDASFWDVRLLYYPRGDTAVRPYCFVGLGTATHRFNDRVGARWWRTNLGMPLGIGVTTRYSERIAIRVEITDHITFGGGSIETMHSPSITGAVEFRWGTTRKVYYPWNPGRHYW